MNKLPKIVPILLGAAAAYATLYIALKVIFSFIV